MEGTSWKVISHIEMGKDKGGKRRSVAVFLQKSGGIEAKFAEYFRRNTCTRQVPGNVLHKKKCIRQSRLTQTVIFLLKNSLFSLWFTTFCREFADSMEPGDS